MSELGVASRREADLWIERGWVLVDGEVVDTLGAKVLRGQEITIDHAAQREQANKITIILHKPVGLVSGQAEDGHEPAVTLVVPNNRFASCMSRLVYRPEHSRGLAPAGRLDIDSTGLLVLTQDGRIAKQLIGETSAMEKEYLVRVEGALPHAKLALLNHGLTLDDIKLKPAKVEWANSDQLRFVLTEGRKRQIRRMCELVGLHVVGLKRVRIGELKLATLPVGKWRYLREFERFYAVPRIY